MNRPLVYSVTIVPAAAFDDIALKSHAQELKEPPGSIGVVLDQQLSRSLHLLS